MDTWVRILYSIFLISLNSTLFAQDVYNEAEIDSVLMELLEDDKDLYELFDGNTQFHFLYMGSTFNSRSFFDGREVGIDQYNLSGQFYYFITNGIYFGVSGSWYSQTDPGFRTTIVTGGFTKALENLKFLRYRINYNRYVYVNQNLNDSLYSPDHNSDVSLGVTLQHKWIGTRLNYTYLMGREDDHEISADIFSKIKLIKLGTFDRIQLEPEVTFYWLREDGEYLDIPSETKENEFGPKPEYIQFDKFGLLDIELALPISISYNSFDLEIGYHVHIPYSFDPEYEFNSSYKGLFKISLGYFISIN